MAVISIATKQQQPVVLVRPIKPLLNDIDQYLYRYGTATDIETDPIELLKQLREAYDELDSKLDNTEDYSEENAQLKEQIAQLRAKIPPWWRG